MKRGLIILFFIVSFGNFTFSQVNYQKTKYVIDYIPFDPKRDAGMGVVLDEDIYEQKFITNRDSLKAMGYSAYDTVTYVITKGYKNRRIEDTNTPTTRFMIQKNNGWFLEGDKKRYTGKFIDYFLNGKKGTEGEFLNGKLNGLFREYYSTGILRAETNYKDGVKEGTFKEYFMNGRVKITGQYFRNQKYQEWNYFYSTNQLNYVQIFDITTVEYERYSPPIISPEQDSVSLKIKDARMHMAYERYTEAIKSLDKAIGFNVRLNEVYFYRGLSKLGMKEDASALSDFEKALEIEPLYVEALQCKGLTLIKKYDWNLFFRHGSFVYTGHETFKIPEADLKQICNSFKLAGSIQILSEVTKQSIERYCQ